MSKFENQSDYCSNKSNFFYAANILRRNLKNDFEEMLSDKISRT
jgi:hypothetical protein